MMQIQKVRAHLQRINTDKYAKFRTAETEIISILEYSQGRGHITLTPHGYSHVTAVELNYDWLLGDSDIEGFNTAECFCLLMATVTHDLLMIPRRTGDEARARRDHAFEPFEFLRGNSERLHISIHEASAIAEVIKAHGVDDLSLVDDFTILGRDKVDLRKLGACLSLADICHADESRAPVIVFNYLSLDTESATHWLRHMQIGGITRNGDKIVVSALAFSDAGERAVREYVASISKELDVVAPYFRSELGAISNVETNIKRLQSPMDQELAFRTNDTSILETLTTGVYERPDVFIRELIQNSLDAGYIREAVERRRGASYDPVIVVTQYWDADGLRAVRVDDNGCGMDFIDIRDVLLTVGSSMAARKSTQELLHETTRKKLIATFGIGILSCLRIAQEIRIITSKGGTDQNIEIVIPPLGGRITANRAADDSQGTTVLVLLKKDALASLNTFYSEDEDSDSGEEDIVERSVYHYCRQITQAPIYLTTTDWDPNLEQLTRSEQMLITISEENRILPNKVEGKCLTRIQGETYSGFIWLDRIPANGDFEEGQVEVLSDGIFVTSERSSAWLSKAFKYCSARINFSAGSVTLSVSRDKVVQDQKYADVRRELAVKARAMVRTLSSLTENPKERDPYALALAAIYDLVPVKEGNRFFVELGEYNVQILAGGVQRLSDIERRNPSAIYLAYSEGPVVKELSDFDGRTLYHKEDDIVLLQSSVLADRGETVLVLARSQRAGGPVEARLISAYFKAAGFNVIDLTKARPVEGMLNSESRPRSLRKRLGPRVKFVHVPAIPEKRAWTIGKEIWLNLSHPEVAKCYEAFQSANESQEIQFLAEIFVELLSCRFSDSLRDVMFRLASVRASDRRPRQEGNSSSG